jgi:hypothetical protein
MENGVIKLVVFNGEDFGCWKNRTSNYLLSQGRAIWETVQMRYAISTTLGKNVYDHVSHLEIAHDVWLKLCNTYEGSFEIK